MHEPLVMFRDISTRGSIPEMAGEALFRRIRHGCRPVLRPWPTLRRLVEHGTREPVIRKPVVIIEHRKKSGTLVAGKRGHHEDRRAAGERIPRPGHAGAGKRTDHDSSRAMRRQRRLPVDHRRTFAWTTRRPIRPDCARQDLAANRPALSAVSDIVAERSEKERVLD